MSGVSIEQVRATYKSRDAWWTVLLVDPIASRVVCALGRITWITPTRLTVAAFLTGIAAGGSFLLATTGWLIVGAALYHVSFLIDCVDGKIARLRGAGSVLGSWLDFLLDRVRVVVCTVALFGGQFLTTGEDWFLLAATGITFLALFGYVNGAETDKAKARMAAVEASGRSGGSRSQRPPMPLVAGRLRTFLHRRRIRMNLVSAVEFEMALFVVGPLVGARWGHWAMMWVAVGAAALLVLFELALIVRFLRAARAFDRCSAGPTMSAPRRGTGPNRINEVGEPATGR